MRKLKLIKIDMSKVDDSNHPDISTRKNYLAKINGGYFAGKFSRQWYGLNFDNWGTSGIQLSHMGSSLWEISSK